MNLIVWYVKPLVKGKNSNEKYNLFIFNNVWLLHSHFECF